MIGWESRDDVRNGNIPSTSMIYKRLASKDVVKEWLKFTKNNFDSS